MLPARNIPKIYTICQGNKTVSVPHRKNHYVLGFKKPTEVRMVMHNLHPEPKFDIVRNSSINLSNDLNSAGFYDIEINMDVGATLFIPKLKGDSLDPLNDGGFHISNHTEEEFLMFPIQKNLGIIIPFYLQEENDDEYIYKVMVMDPSRI